jgi:hypothetical protein
VRQGRASRESGAHLHDTAQRELEAAIIVASAELARASAEAGTVDGRGLAQGSRLGLGTMLGSLLATSTEDTAGDGGAMRARILWRATS